MIISTKEDALVCPVAALKEHILFTKSFTITNDNTVTKLFLSFIKPHNPVSTASVARWILSVLKLSGINTAIFKTHSVMGAAATNAYLAGMPLPQILKVADWSNEHTFHKHYLQLPK